VDAARQVIRWSIPGTIFLLVVLFGQLEAALAYGVHTNFGTEVSQSDASLLIVLIGATIPIGFLLYQVYHVFLEEAVSWLPPFAVPLDRGRQILQQLDGAQRRRIREQSGISHIDDSLLASGRIRPWRLKDVLGAKEVPSHLAGASPRQVYAYIRHQNWRAVKWALFNELPEDRSALIRREYTGFADIYHSIGASRMAVMCGYCGLALYDLAVHTPSFANWPRLLLTLAAWVITCSVTFAVLTYARRHTLVSIQDLVTDSLRAYVQDPDQDSVPSVSWVARRWRILGGRSSGGT
jgi:hypothetical protein